MIVSAASNIASVKCGGTGDCKKLESFAVWVVLAGIDVDVKLRLRRRRHPNHCNPCQVESLPLLPSFIESLHVEITFRTFPATVKPQN